MNDHGLNKMVNIPAYNYFITFFLSMESLSGCVWIGGRVGGLGEDWDNLQREPYETVLQNKTKQPDPYWKI